MPNANIRWYVRHPAHGTALDGSMGAAGSGMGGVFGITGSGMGAFGIGVWRIPERLLSIFTILWLAGVILFTGYAVYSYVRVRRQVAEAMWLRENLWICDEVKSPFILGLQAEDLSVLQHGRSAVPLRHCS